jgi:hypothetical protein
MEAAQNDSIKTTKAKSAWIKVQTSTGALEPARP